MTLRVSEQVPPVGTKLVVDDEADEVAKIAVTGAAGNLYQVDVDNEANAAASYLKVYDAASPTVGTTAPDFIFRVAAGQRRGLVIPDGWYFSYLSFAVVTSGGTAGTTGPTSAVTVRMVTT